MPASAVTATASVTSRPIGIARIPTAVSLISRAPIFLPRYSGVRPTMSPATNTATTTNSSIPYSPEPTPPGATSPRLISVSVTAPPPPVSASCPPLTAPDDVPVVAAAKAAVAAAPKRTSLSAMLPPELPSPAASSTPLRCRTSDPRCSKGIRIAIATTSIAIIAANSAQPWRREPTMRPKVAVSAKAISSWAISSRWLVSGVGFSSGTAEFAL